MVLFFADQVISLASVGVALFWTAGRFDWWPAWAALAVLGAWLTAMDIILVGCQPGLLAERLHPPRGIKSWDRAIVSLIRLLQLTRYILAGLDQRYGWTAGFPQTVQIAALAICVLGYALFGWALASNAFFSQIVRIQTDRGHRVAEGGPYRIVRHPGYVGAILFELTMPILLDSEWSLLVSALCAMLFILRTALEDRTLLAELDGYAAYASRVRYRLLPGLW